jgi:hypothetical protein
MNQFLNSSFLCLLFCLFTMFSIVLRSNYLWEIYSGKNTDIKKSWRILDYVLFENLTMWNFSLLMDEYCTGSHIFDWLWECDDLGVIVNCIWLQWNGFQTTNYLGFEVLTAVVMKSTVFWDITQYVLLKVNWRFGGTRRLHLSGSVDFQKDYTVPYPRRQNSSSSKIHGVDDVAFKWAHQYIWLLSLPDSYHRGQCQCPCFPRTAVSSADMKQAHVVLMLFGSQIV